MGDQTLQNPIALGPFELLERIGEGGMAEVFRGVHRRDGVAVAVKVLDLVQKDKRRVRMFAREIQSAALLDHPNIVGVYDFGVVSPEVAESTGGGLEARSPYLVMELVEGSSLAERGPVQSWQELETILFCLLDALAHAHARGVVHRDVKPGNVLLSAANEGGPGGLKLGDFGIAFAIETRRSQYERDLNTSGTIHYMAPEQVGGRWRDQGPWTDLYALGCLVYRLVQGSPPFFHPGVSLKEVARAHVHQQAPPIVAPFELPRGFHRWLDGMLDKQPLSRYRFAADAREELVRCANGESLRSSIRARTAGKTILHTPIGPTSLARRDQDPRAADQGASRFLSSVGLGMFGVRAMPMVGRHREREVLWDQLERAEDQRTIRIALVRGPAGVGKSRLARWLCERALELGAATALNALHDPMGGPFGRGLSGMLVNFLRCHGLGARRLRARVEGILLERGIEDAYRVETLASIMLGEPDGARSRLTHSYERYRLVWENIALLCRERPVLICIDDVQWGLDALRFVEWVAAEPERRALPVTIVLTVRDEALREGGEVTTRCAAIAGDPAAVLVPLEPLALDEHRQLVEKLLGLDQALVDEVAARTEGNPLFAVQLIGDWVHRGVIEASEGGFVISSGERTILPDDIQKLWQSRLDRLTEGRNRSLDAIELGACLGQHVETTEWTLACASIGFSDFEPLLAEMVRAGLAQREEEGWTFEHGMLRETVIEGARANGRLEARHTLCADTLERLNENPSVDVFERIAHHRHLASEHLRAFEAFFDAGLTCDDVLRKSDLFSRALELSEHLEESALTTRATTELARALRTLGRQDHARQLATAAEAHARLAGQVAEQVRALEVLAIVAIELGDLIEAETIAREALQLCEEIDDKALESRTQHVMGLVCRFRGELDEALGYFETEAKLSRLPRDKAVSMLARAQIHGLKGNLERAIALAMSALEICRERGLVEVRAEVLTALGEFARMERRWDDALLYYSEALSIFESTGSKHAHVIATNLALTLIATGVPSDARPLLQDARNNASESGNQLLLAAVMPAQLAVSALTGDFEAWDQLMVEILSFFETMRVVDEDTVWAFGVAIDAAERAGEHHRARSAREFASGFAPSALG